ncbi:MAG: WD40/YVTN/BNR-like repeat-containing protein [Lysobacterales bacterium]
MTDSAAKFCVAALLGLIISLSAAAADKNPLTDLAAGLKIRDIGPAVTSGRISDFAMHPDGWHQFYAATASGGLWKTDNAGTTWKPIFDNEGSYSIGVVELDPENPNVVWVGTGENNAQRSVAYGDGVYKSVDAGASWNNVGLADSGHIGQIAIHPNDSNVVFVAAQGPLWNSGGDRGVYRTKDGGDSWDRVLEVDEHTGANNVLIHPDRPDLVLASTYQRRRHVWTLINGGPGSAVYRSTDGGETFSKITAGLPPHDKGRIGLAFAPSRPDTVYAVIETDDEHEGLYRSTDFGARWEKRSGYSAGSPQYYNELVVDPNNPDRVYSMDTFMQVSNDGGKSFSAVGSAYKHVDEHALYIDPANSNHLITGNDGGIYQSWDAGANWRFVENLPIAQFYRATPDNDLPFYNVYGGTQDNNSLGGPSRTLFDRGITNEDWTFTLGGDGFKTQVDPTNPDTVYSQLQHGLLARFDRQSFERVIITPAPGADENDHKWNWNSAFIISPHSSQRLYFAAEKLFRSDDGGNAWQAVSDDLTRQLDRNTLEVMGRVWGVNTVAKNNSTSMYGSIVSLDESPLEEGLLFVGTDDGLIQVSSNGGESWRREDRFGRVPEMSYVGDLVASQHSADRVYAAFDNHKKGDFKPYLLRSDDRGASWKSIVGNLPERGTVHTVAEDHVNPDLLFAGTEFGVFYTQDGGKTWGELTGGMPTIAVRDMEIQRRENDLVLGTFGRGIRILDDYTPLRIPAADISASQGTLFPVKPTWLYAEKAYFAYGPKGFMGASYYTADNPPYGAVFTYHLKDSLKTLKKQRREAERKRQKDGEDNPYPTMDALREEAAEQDPVVELSIFDADGNFLRRITGPTGKGMHRVAWDMRLPAPEAVNIKPAGPRAPWDSEPKGTLVAPGNYSVSLAMRVRGELTSLGEPQDFVLKTLDEGQFRPASPKAQAEEMAQANALARSIAAAQGVMGELNNRVAHLKVALRDTPVNDDGLYQQLAEVEANLRQTAITLSGDRVVARTATPTPMSVSARMGLFQFAHWDALAGITDNQRASLAIATEQLTQVNTALAASKAALDTIDNALGASAPWTPGRAPMQPQANN